MLRIEAVADFSHAVLLNCYHVSRHSLPKRLWFKFKAIFLFFSCLSVCAADWLRMGAKRHKVTTSGAISTINSLGGLKKAPIRSV